MRISITNKQFLESLELPIALGFAQLGTKKSHSSSHIDERMSVIRELAEYGRVFIDTSPIYGSGFSETIIGSFLSNFNGQYFLATKYYPEDNHRARDVIKSLTRSLKRLKVEKVDLLQLHWPNPKANLFEVIQGLHYLREQEKIGGLGTCNFINQENIELSKVWPEELLTNQQELNLTNIDRFEALTFPKCGRIISYGTLLQGRLTFSRKQYKFLVDVSRNLGLNPAELTLLIIKKLYPEITPVLKLSSLEHLRGILNSNFKYLDDSITKEFLDIEGSKIYYAEAKSIRLEGDSNRPPYKSLREAMENKLNLIPSPEALALRIKRFNLVLPLKVRKITENRYHIDAKDPFDQIKKYWAYQIAYPESKIPIIINEL